jgi:Tfp pilus assembly protein PilE
VLNSRVSRASARGFTLAEMAITVTIVMILSVLGVVGYKKLIASSHMSEPNKMVVQIGMAQEDYAGRGMGYANISPNLNTTYPAAEPGAYKTAWGAACGGQCNSTAVTWADLNLRVDEPVMFGYATVAGFAWIKPTPNEVTVGAHKVTFPDKPATNWWIVGAKGDTDGDKGYCRVYYTSFNTKQIFVDNEGE